MSNNGDIRKNGSGYYDPTAYEAMSNAETEARFKKWLETVFSMSELSGFHIEGRITVRDKKTGRVWR